MSVADVGTANGAAASLHRTQAAVSMQIRRLEEAVGAQLFDRSANGLTLSAGGLLLRPYARQILSFSDELKHRIGDYRVEGRVKLGAVQDFAATRLIQILKAFHDQNPLVQIDLIVSSAEPLPLILFEGSCPWRNRAGDFPAPVDIDIGLCASTQAPTQARYLADFVIRTSGTLFPSTSGTDMTPDN